jgi:haloalkane dehalogenase
MRPDSDHGGTGLHYVDEGAGAPAVLVHGTPTWSFEWRHVIAGLRDEARLIAPDHLGFGLSTDRRRRPAGRPRRPVPRVHRRRVPAGTAHAGRARLGGPIALDWALDHPDRLARLVIINSWMWSFDDDPSMTRKARFAASALGRWMYRRLNASQRLIMPSAYGDRRRLTPAVHQQYLEVFPDADSRERVLFALAQSMLGSRAFFNGLWQRRARLADVDVQVVWGLRDSAFPPAMLARWQQAVPHACVTRIDEAGHWPHEEAPEAVIDALRRALAVQTRVL